MTASPDRRTKAPRAPSGRASRSLTAPTRRTGPSENLQRASLPTGTFRPPTLPRRARCGRERRLAEDRRAVDPGLPRQLPLRDALVELALRQHPGLPSVDPCSLSSVVTSSRQRPRCPGSGQAETPASWTATRAGSAAVANAEDAQPRAGIGGPPGTRDRGNPATVLFRNCDRRDGRRGVLKNR